MWATDTSYLNDSQELLYAKELIADHLTVLCEYPDWENFKTAPDEKDLLKTYRDMFGRISRVPDVFVASFSKKPDSLSRWREYGRYSICVSGEALKTCAQQAHGLLSPCVYDQLTQMKLVRGSVRSLIELYRHNRDKCRFYNRMFESLLCRLGALIKHSSFEDECEWRIVVPHVTNPDHRNFRSNNEIVVPYVDVDIGPALQSRLERPVTPQIGIGPGNKRLSVTAIKHLSEKTLGFEAWVQVSDSPYVRD